MDDRIQEVLQLCLERLEKGASIEECLAQFPEEADRLEPLLQAALETRGMFAAGVPAAARVRLRNQVMTEWDRGHQRRLPKLRVPLLLPRWAVVAAAVVLVVAFGGVGTVAAAGAAVPGDQLYPVKELREAAQLWFARSPEAKVDMYTRLVKERAEEVQWLADRDDARSEAISQALDRMNRHLAALNKLVEENFERNGGGPKRVDAGSLDALRRAADGQQAAQIAIRKTIVAAPSSARPSLEAALEAIQQAHGRVSAAVEAAAPSGSKKRQ